MPTHFPADVIEQLKRPVNPQRVVTGQNGPLRGVKYLEAWDVIERANELFGYAGWSSRMIGSPFMMEAGTQGQNQTPYEVWACIVEVTVAGATYQDLGTNTRQGTGSAGLEMAVKGAVSDGVKRCLRYLGNQFGLSLYDKLDPLDQHEQQAQQRKATPPAGEGGGVSTATNPSPAKKAQVHPEVIAIGAWMKQSDIPADDEAVMAVLGEKASVAALTMWVALPGHTAEGFIDAVGKLRESYAEAQA